MNIAFVGCGYVADFYMATLDRHPELNLLGVFDRDPDRLRAFCNYHQVRYYGSLPELLNDASVELVLDLTNPRSRFDVTRAAIAKGKHVYAEKPLALDYDSAVELSDLATEKHVILSAAPCSLLGETAQTMWKALREGVIGPVRLVYANFDAGMIHRSNLSHWKSVSGAPWPAKDEFEVGCTYEHAGYFLTWLAAFFGRAQRVAAFAATLIRDKGISLDMPAPDFAVGCIEYGGGIVARATTGIVAPRDRSLTIVGEEGVLYTRDIRDDASVVLLAYTPGTRLGRGIEFRLDSWRGGIERRLSRFPWSWGTHWRFYRRYPFARKPQSSRAGRFKRVDFLRGPAEVANAVRQGRRPRLAADLAAHVTEILEVLQYPDRFGGQRVIRSGFAAIEPLEWTA